ncbi:minor tail protein [Stenotrophomonas virus Jojan60]|nr:minor tail protein [Stenotrophomonas virus Jojan60]
MGRVDLTLYRQFYTEGAYSESPVGSGYYTLGSSVETPAGSGLYSLSTLEETPAGSGLYAIPQNGRLRQTSNIEQYSVQEDATTLDPSNFFGGSAQSSVNVPPGTNAKEFITATLTLNDTVNGIFQGVVRAMEQNDGSLQITADSLLGLLNVDRKVAPQHTTLQAAFMYYFELLTLSGRLSVHPSIASRAVTYPGWDGNMWDHLKQIMVAEQIELATIGNTFYLRPPRTKVLNSDHYTQSGWALNNQNTSKRVRIHYYQNTYGTQQEIYPVPPTPVMWRDREGAREPAEPQIYSVDAGETLTIIVDLNASMMSLNQPTCVDFVEDRSYTGTNGVYAVAGNDGKPIKAEQWTAQGGSLSVRLLDDPSQMEITIRGAMDSALAPYRIAMTAGTNSYYNSLHVTGTGILTEDRYVDLHTGTTTATTGDEVGAEVTNPFIDTLSKAYFVGSRAAAAYALDATSRGAGSPRLMSPGPALGAVAGARLEQDDVIYRVKNASIGPDLITIDASLDTLIGDINDKFNGKTMGEMSDIWANRTMLDFSLAPLRGE